MKKEKQAIVIILIAFILVLLIICGGTIKKKQYGKMPETIDGKTEEGQLLYNGVGVFVEKYTGYIISSRKFTILTFKTMITEEWPEMIAELKNADDKKINEYYEKNKKELEENYGFKDVDSFINMINTLRDRDIDLSKYDKLDVNKETFGDTSDKPNYAVVQCKVMYPEDNSIKFKAYISKKKSIKPSFIISME